MYKFLLYVAICLAIGLTLGGSTTNKVIATFFALLFVGVIWIIVKVFHWALKKETGDF